MCRRGLYSHTHLDSHADANLNLNADSHTHAYCNANPNPHTAVHTDADRDAIADRYPNAHADPCCSPGERDYHCDAPIGIQVASLLVAIQGGYITEEGVNATLSTFDEGRELQQAVRLGSVALVVAAMRLVVQSVDSPRPLVAIGAISGRPNLNIVVAGNIAQDRGLTSASSLDERLAALKGLKIGHPPGPLVGVNLATKVLEVAGLSLDGDTELIAVPGEDQVSALREGKIQALVGHHPYLEEAIVQEGAFLVVHASAGELSSLEPFPLHVLATTPDYIAQNGEILQAVLRGLLKAQQVIRDDPDLAKEIIMAALPELDRPNLEEGIKIYFPAVPPSPFITPEGYSIITESLGLSEVGSFDEVVDNSFANAASEP